MQHEGTESEHERPVSGARWHPLAVFVCVLATAAGVSLLAAAMMWPMWMAHRVAPHPKGLVFQHELLATRAGIFGYPFEVFAIDRGGPAVAILEHEPEGGEAMIRVLRYPTGELLHVAANPDASEMGALRSQRLGRDDDAFDFDGDGIGDLLQTPPGGDHSVGVISGRDRSVLFFQVDPLEYEPNERATPLGDLDGDGCSELAVLHPRADRSTYDIELGDRFFGAKSWLSIVSGKLATR
jgi:hypothetical protein